MEISGKGLLHFHKNLYPLSVIKLITGQTCVCLANPTLALSRTMGVFVYCNQWQNMQCSFKYFEQCMFKVPCH